MARSDMYRKLPWTGGDARSVAEIVNNLVEGKSNNTGTITLATGNATTTLTKDGPNKLTKDFLRIRQD